MKLILVMLSVFALTACSSDYTPKDKTNSYIVPDELKDCSISELSANWESTITVVRCPLSSTTTHWTERHGKTNTDYTIVTIDGKKYQKLDKDTKKINIDNQEYVELK